VTHPRIQAAIVIVIDDLAEASLILPQIRAARRSIGLSQL
jgi:hypothetical protein